MPKKLEKIYKFIEQHHVMSLATHGEDGVDICSVFYAFLENQKSFVVASDSKTQHIQNIIFNNHVAGNILLETEQIGKIQGLQFRAKMQKLHNKELEKLYFKTFPYALALNPQLWEIKVEYFKFTDNRLGFGKKLIWP
jgi:uncharacterized protein YhbP (UPF0306 family)